jgi:Transcriptional regulator/sugar kinase
LRVTRFRTGIDLGGSKIEAIVLNENGEEVFRHRIPTPQNSYSNTVAAIEYLINKADETVNTETKSWHWDTRVIVPNNKTSEKRQLHLADRKTFKTRS